METVFGTILVWFGKRMPHKIAFFLAFIFYLVLFATLIFIVIMISTFFVLMLHGLGADIAMRLILSAEVSGRIFQIIKIMLIMQIVFFLLCFSFEAMRIRKQTQIFNCDFYPAISGLAMGFLAVILSNI